MNKIMFTTAIVVGVGIAFGVGGYFVGQSAWDSEREMLETQLARMTTELETSKDKVRQHRIAARKAREARGGRSPKRGVVLLERRQ